MTRVGQDTPTPAEQWDQHWWVIFNDLLKQADEIHAEMDVVFAAHLIADRETREQFGERPGEP